MALLNLCSQNCTSVLVGAQLVEHHPIDQEVTGSIPVGAHVRVAGLILLGGVQIDGFFVCLYFLFLFFFV